MLISRIRLRMDRVKLLEASRFGADAYDTHQILWRLFGDQDQRTFMYRRDQSKRWPTYIVVSSLEPVDPDQYWLIETKPYEPKVKADQRLAFTLTANPVVTRKGPDGRRRRHDVVMDAKKQSDTDVKLAERAQSAGLAWLESRAPRCGFRFDPEQVRADGYRQHRLYKPKTSPIRFSTLDFNGVLTVSDPDVFVQTLYEGIGPAKAFGCGLMLVRPS